MTDHYSGTRFAQDEVDLEVYSKKEERRTITEHPAFDQQQEIPKSLNCGVIICSKNTSSTCADTDKDTLKPATVIDELVVTGNYVGTPIKVLLTAPT